MDQRPDLKVYLAHGGGYACFGIGKMDRDWRVRSEARVNIHQPPGAYLSKFYYDCLTHGEPALTDADRHRGSRARGSGHRLTFRHGD